MTQPKAPEPVEPAETAPGQTVPVPVPRSMSDIVSAPVATVDQPTAAYQLVPGDAGEPAAPARDLAGDIAVDVARQLVEPVRSLHERLGLVVDQIERHVATSTGPAPYPWRQLQTLRHDLAAAYLEATNLARRIDELDRALASEPPRWFDVAAATDLGIHLAGHHLAAGLELLIDLGQVPPARGAPGALALLVAQLVATSARSARDLPGSTVSVRVAPEGAAALIAIADNGAGSTRAAALGDLARSVLAPWGGTVDATSVAGAGCTFELHLVTAPEPSGDPGRDLG